MTQKYVSLVVTLIGLCFDLSAAIVLGKGLLKINTPEKAGDKLLKEEVWFDEENPTNDPRTIELFQAFRDTRMGLILLAVGFVLQGVGAIIGAFAS